MFVLVFGFLCLLILVRPLLVRFSDMTCCSVRRKLEKGGRERGYKRERELHASVVFLRALLCDARRLSRVLSRAADPIRLAAPTHGNWEGARG